MLERNLESYNLSLFSGQAVDAFERKINGRILKFPLFKINLKFSLSPAPLDACRG
jgi:hypothetical protein